MHQVDFDLNINEITKVEGSAGLDVKVKDGKVESVKFKIQDYKRFYTHAIEGKPLAAVPQLLSRICGTCSNAHLMASIEAVEKTLGFTPTEQTKIQRTLTYHGLIIRDHALHLYIFVLPDLFNKDSIFDLDEGNELEHQLLHDTFEVKAAGNHLAIAAAGRSVHAPFPVAGGFLKTPDPKQIPGLIKELENIRLAVLRLIKVFADCPFELIRPANYVALVNDNFSYLEGEIRDKNGLVAQEQDFRSHLEHVVMPYSQASAYKFQGEPYRVGSLARINLNQNALHQRTKQDAKAALKIFPSDNIHHNNLAQAIEILHSVDDAIDILTNFTFQPEKPVKLTMRAATGVGVVEAPRGTLYHKLEVDAKGVVIKGEVIVPTGQNQLAIELDIAEYIQQNLDKDKAQLTHECEKIIRAYDPCMSCASHFLKIKWIED